MTVQHGLHFTRIDVHAAGDHHVFFAIDNVEISLIVTLCQIAHADPAILESGFGLFGLGPITVEQIRRVAEQFSDLVRANFASRVIQQPHPVSHKGQAHTFDLAQLVGGPQIGDNTRLGRPIGFMQQACAEIVDNLFLHVLRKRRRVGHNSPQPIAALRCKHRGRQAEHAVIMGGHRKKPRHVTLVQGSQHGLRIKFGHDFGRAAEEDGGKCKGEPCAMAHRRYREEMVVGTEDAVFGRVGQKPNAARTVR